LEDFKQKKGFLGQIQCLLGPTAWYIAYDTELNLQLCNYTQTQNYAKRHICCENSESAPDESFVTIFALAERLPTSATLVKAKNF